LGGGAPQRGGSVTYADIGPVLSLDPIKDTSSPGGVEADAVYGEPMRYDAKTQTYVPYMAKGLTHNGDNSVWTLSLRPNVNFSDGTPYNAQAIVSDLKRLMDPANHAADAVDFRFVKSMDTPDDHTVVFNLSKPYGNFQIALANRAYIPAPSYVAKLQAGDANATPIGAGPFVVSSFRPGEDMTVTRSPTYWGPAPYLDSIHFISLAGATTALQAFQAGQVQVTPLQGDPQSVKQAETTHIPYFSAPGTPQGVLFDTKRGQLFNDVRLRQAVAMGVDPNLWNERVNQGLALATTDLFPTSSRWHDASMKGPPYDPAKAKQLVSEVKAQTGWDGTVKYTFWNSPNNAAQLVALESMLDPLGFKVVSGALPDVNALISQVIVKQDYQMAQWGVGPEFADANPFDFFSEFVYGNAGNNYGFYSDPRMDAAIDHLQLDTTTAATKKDLATINQVWNETIPLAYFGGETDALVIYSPKLHGLIQGGYTSNVQFDTAWLSP
jgi:peptide/nickel transport system substrate-binding protein